jgi:hypothetical protein
MITGTYIYYEDGKEIGRSKNIITKFGKRYLTNLLAGKVETADRDMAFGIGSTAATVDDTRLEFEFYRLPVGIYSTDIQTDTDGTTYAVVYKATLPQDVSGVISEIGIYPSTRTSSNNYDSKFLSEFSSPLDWEELAGGNPSLGYVNGKIGETTLEMYSGTGASKEYVTSVIPIDLSGYSKLDSLSFVYYQNDLNLSNIKIRFYSDVDKYYQIQIAPAGGVGYKMADEIYLEQLFAGAVNGPDLSSINRIGIVVTPVTGQQTSIGADGLRINDEDTFDPNFGIISRSILSSPLYKTTGRTVDVEYRLDLNL